MKNLTFKGMSISRQQFEERYEIQLSDAQWNTLVKQTEQSWIENADELRLLAFKHIRQGMSELGYKVDLRGKDIIFKPK